MYRAGAPELVNNSLAPVIVVRRQGFLKHMNFCKSLDASHLYLGGGFVAVFGGMACGRKTTGLTVSGLLPGSLGLWQCLELPRCLGWQSGSGYWFRH
jgi:hypothetical protein